MQNDIRINIHFYVAVNHTIDITTLVLNEIRFLFGFYLNFGVLFFFYSHFTPFSPLYRTFAPLLILKMSLLCARIIYIFLEI